MSRIPHPRFLAFLVVFLATTLLLALRLAPEEALILGFDLAALIFVASTLPLWRADGSKAARARAARDDGGRGLLLLTSVAVLAVILLALGRLVGEKSGGIGFGAIAGTLILAWLFVNLIFAFHYDHLFHDKVSGKDAGGIQFPEGGEPVFADFVYFAFTIGMTCQTADLDISSRVIRRAVTLHGLFAFFFNLGVLAFAVNVMAGVL
ncbi:DUF1345 domain-containing protein [Rhodobacter sp.]